MEDGERHDLLHRTFVSKLPLSLEPRDGCLDWERMSASTDKGRLREQVLSLHGASSLQNEKNIPLQGPVSDSGEWVMTLKVIQDLQILRSPQDQKPKKSRQNIALEMRDENRQ